jgi:hypothetical protein
LSKTFVTDHQQITPTTNSSTPVRNDGKIQYDLCISFFRKKIDVSSSSSSSSHMVQKLSWVKKTHTPTPDI